MDAKTLIFNVAHSNKSILDKVYNKHINMVINTLDEEDECRWEIYGIIIQELLNNQREDIFKEIKYRLTDGENPNEVFLSIIERDLDGFDGTLWFLKKRIEEYLEEDSYKRFYK
jgi:hypothetical protein